MTIIGTEQPDMLAKPRPQVASNMSFTCTLVKCQHLIIVLLAGDGGGITSLGTGDTAASQVDTSSSGVAAGSGSEEAGALEGQLLSSCVDLEEGCIEWAAEDGCINHGPSFMFERCRRSCGVCGQPFLTDVPETVGRLLLLHLCCSSVLSRTCTTRYFCP